jgi:hypothetical protein
MENSVLEVINRWRVHSRKWQPHETAWREYLEVVADSGPLCLADLGFRESAAFLMWLNGLPLA